ncbi:MAG TPA: phosphoglycerate dehydrogenase [Candidatus Limnocylindrales bacterium]|nr:phosphoglycerate dehydrogenase [Candidatus Limnocylindrales bacterium]
MARILVSDKLDKQGLEILQAAPGLEVDNNPGLPPDELKKIIGKYEGLVIRSGTKVTADLLEAATSLKIVGRAGIGVDNVDVEAASKRGVIVANTPGGNNVTTGEHAISMMLACARDIPQANATLRAGQWKRNDFMGIEVTGKTIGVIGLGNIGAIVADRAKGLKMNVIGYDPFVNADAAARAGIELVSLDEMYARADFISVHTPLTADTRGLIGEAAIAKMKKGVRIINCARGGIIDEAALLAALNAGHVGGAALDVFATEPPTKDDPLVTHPKVVATPHLGASTGEAQLNVAIAVAEQIRDFFADGTIRNAINVPSLSAEAAGAIAPYVSLGEKIGCLHAQLAGCAPNEIVISYNGEVADLDVRPVNAAVLKGLLSSVLDVPLNAVNAPFLAKDRGVKITEVKNRDSKAFSNSVSVTFKRGDQSRRIEGAVFGGKIVRLVRFDDFFLEAVPEGNILILHNRDVPGVVGRLGTFLAEHNVNIAGLSLGRSGPGGEAVAFYHVDSPLNAGQLDKLRSLQDVTSAQMVKL